MAKQSYLIHQHLSKKRKIAFLDYIVLIASFVSPATGIPQAIDTFQGHVEGVSLVSWVGFVFFSLLFLSYGLIHKVKPMIVSNFLWVIVESSVVIGILHAR